MVSCRCLETCVHARVSGWSPGSGPARVARILALSATICVVSLVASSAHADDSNGLMSCIRCAGDVDHDGIPDLIVASRDDLLPELVWLLSGKDLSVLHAWTGAEAGDRFGSALDTAGDVDRDGVPDIIVAADGAPTHASQGYGQPWSLRTTHGTYARVLSGKDGRVLLEISAASAPSCLPTRSVAAAGDVNRDGCPDLLVGSPASGSEVPGRARVYSGRDGSVLHEIVGVLQEPQKSVRVYRIDERGDITEKKRRDRFVSDGFGMAVAGLGDLDRDGCDDFAVSAPCRFGEPVASHGSSQCFGGLDVFSGKSGSRILSIAGDPGDDGLGWAVGGVGDVDEDGVADFYGIALHHYLRVYSGASGKPLYRIPPRAVMDAFGSSADSGSDLDGDGVPDLVVGADEAMRGFFDEGYAAVYSGKDGKQTSLLFKSREEGVEVCVLGDLDRDSIPELALVIHGRWKSERHVLRILRGKDREILREIDLRRLRTKPAGLRDKALK